MFESAKTRTSLERDKYQHEMFDEVFDPFDFPFLAAQGSIVAYRLFARAMLAISNGIPNKLKEMRPNLIKRMMHGIFGVFANADLLGQRMADLMEKRGENAIRHLTTFASAVNADKMTMDRFKDIVAGREVVDWEYLHDDIKKKDNAEHGSVVAMLSKVDGNKTPVGSVLEKLGVSSLEDVLKMPSSPVAPPEAGSKDAVQSLLASLRRRKELQAAQKTESTVETSIRRAPSGKPAAQKPSTSPVDSTG